MSIIKSAHRLLALSSAPSLRLVKVRGGALPSSAVTVKVALSVPSQRVSTVCATPLATLCVEG